MYNADAVLSLPPNMEDPFPLAVLQEPPAIEQVPVASVPDPLFTLTLQLPAVPAVQ